MKKILAILLALMMVLACTAAFATGDGTGEGEGGGAASVVSIDPTSVDTAGTPTKAAEVTIKKSIDATNVYRTDDKHSKVTFKFTVTDSKVELSTETAAPAVEFVDLTVNEGAGEGDLTIKLPSYKAVGIYTYTVNEETTGIAGFVDAAENSMELKVTVIQDGDNLKVAGIAFRQDGEKTDEIKNTYKAGALKVTKVVKGNMGDRTKEFPITITLTAPDKKVVESTVVYAINGSTTTTTVTWTDKKTAEVNVNLKHDDYVEIFNLPENVTWSVAEDDETKNGIKHLSKSNEEQTNADAYLVEIDTTTGTIAAKTESTATVTNTKDIDIDTGVALDSTVYMLILALALAGFVALKVRREEN